MKQEEERNEDREHPKRIDLEKRERPRGPRKQATYGHEGDPDLKPCELAESDVAPLRPTLRKIEREHDKTQRDGRVAERRNVHVLGRDDDNLRSPQCWSVALGATQYRQNPQDSREHGGHGDRRVSDESSDGPLRCEKRRC